MKSVSEVVYDITIKEKEKVGVEFPKGKPSENIYRLCPIRYTIVRLEIDGNMCYGVARCSRLEEKYNSIKGRDIARTRAMRMYEHIVRGIPELMVCVTGDDLINDYQSFIPALVGTMPLNPLVINKMKEIVSGK